MRIEERETMIEAQAHVEGEATREALEGPHGRTRTCVGCGEHVDLLREDEGAEMVRLVLGPGGEIAVDAGSRRGGGFGRGAHVHARPECLERAARAGLLRVTKGKAHVILDDEGGAPAALSAGTLARAIQRAMDRRIEGLLAAAVRSRQVARGADAVVGSCRRGEAALVVVACDAAAAADLTEVRRAVAEGRAVAWGTKQRLGAIAPGAVRGRLRAPQGVRPDAEGVGVVAVASRTIAEALRRAVQAGDRVSAVEGSGPHGPAGQRGRRSKGAARPPGEGPGARAPVAHGGNEGNDERSEGGAGSPERGLSGEESNVERGA